MVNSGLDDRPFDRALFAAFAELVRAGGNGPVADVGCGAGRVTILLSRLGLDVFGVDLSPGMVSLARRNYPQLRFEEGSMLALDAPAAGLGGLLAYYSIIHIARERRPKLFAEFHRVLAPGGVLMHLHPQVDLQGPGRGRNRRRGAPGSRVGVPEVWGRLHRYPARRHAVRGVPHGGLR